MAVQQNGFGHVNKSHVNLMTDTIIANLPTDGLRSVMRSVLTTDPLFTSAFEEHTRRYLQKATIPTPEELFAFDQVAGWRTTPSFHQAQQLVRASLGCGLSFESLKQIRAIVDQAADVSVDQNVITQQKLALQLISVDGDIVQAITAVQKALIQPTGRRDLTETERADLDSLHQSLSRCQSIWTSKNQEFLFERSLGLVAETLDRPLPQVSSVEKQKSGIANGDAHNDIETFVLSGVVLPRLFSGLWQLSSPSWGVASRSKIFQQFSNFVSKGFTAYDMADHYGDAEVLFVRIMGQFRSSYDQPHLIFGSTKYCVFQPLTITEKVVRDNVTERCQRLKADHVDLLQFHWQFYEDPQYIEALRLLEADDRVKLLGLCNFDTQRMEEILDAGIKVVSNQVQFSIIDSRPTVKMGKVCEKYGIKLLTYGTLCGGFLADKWLGKPEPKLFADDMTPSQRKYFEMIQAWGGWELFQELLHVLQVVADKHKVAVSNVATRWVLDFPYVGAVIVGARMGVSEHSDQNLASYGWHLDEEDQAAIDAVLVKSRRTEIFEVMGDCGGEYR